MVPYFSRVLAIGWTGCADDEIAPSAPGNGATESASEETAGLKTVTSSDKTTVEASQASDSKSDAATVDEAENTAPSLVAPPHGDDEVAKMLTDCGVNETMVAGWANEVLLQKRFNALPFSKTQMGVTANLGGTLDIMATGASTTETINISVTSLSGLLAAFGRNMAEQQAAANSGSITFDNLPFQDLLGLNKYDQYKGITCTLMPATKVVSRLGGKNTVATFNPPLPAAISPRALLSRYQTEIGDRKVFSNLTASIVSSDDPALQGKSQVSGTVTIERVTPSGSDVAADIAFTVTSNFETPAITNALGMIPSITYYINTIQKDLLANTVDLTSAGSPVVNFK